jgi:hypothetical protein
MMMTDGCVLGAVELELLLPWFVTGTLGQEKAAAVEYALARSPEFACRLEIVRQERAAAIFLNESLVPPSARPMIKLMSALGAKTAPNRRASRR